MPSGISDFHVHSSYSDGASSIEEIVQKANSLKLVTIGISDHFWPSWGSRKGGKGIIENRRMEIKDARMAYPGLKLLDAAEVDIQSDGSLAPIAGGLKQFDLVIGSFHWGSDSTTWVSSLKKALRRKEFQILGHWDGYLSSYKEEDGQLAVEALAEAKVAIELNGRYKSENIEFLELAKDIGCIFTFGSDSHHVSTVGQVDYQSKLASDLGLKIVDYDQLIVT